MEHPSCSNDTIPPRPVALPVRLAGIPHELRTLKRFVVWGYTLVTDEAGAFVKYDKPPRQPRDPTQLASSTNAKTWGTLAEANTALAKYPELLDGLGFPLGAEGTRLATGDFVSIGDFDGCRDPETGVIDPDALAIVNELATYAEISPSGEGLRIVGRGDLLLHGLNRPWTWSAGQRGRIEWYGAGKYLTLTGHRLEGCPETIEPVQAAVGPLLARVLATTDRPAAPVSAHRPGLTADDTEILERARSRAKTGAKFVRLFDQGDRSDYPGRDGRPDESAADLGLCNLLRFEVGADAARIDTLYRQSAIARAKWDEPRGQTTWGAGTLAKALPGDVYDARTLAPVPAMAGAAVDVLDPPFKLETPPEPSPGAESADPRDARIAHLEATVRAQAGAILELQHQLVECQRAGTERVREARRETAIVRRLYRNPKMRTCATTYLAATYAVHAEQVRKGTDPALPRPLSVTALAARTDRTTSQVSKDLTTLKAIGLLDVHKPPDDADDTRMHVAAPALRAGLLPAITAGAAYTPPAAGQPAHGGDRRSLAAVLNRRQRIPRCELHTAGPIRETWEATCTMPGCGVSLAADQHDHLAGGVSPAKVLRVGRRPRLEAPNSRFQRGSNPVEAQIETPSGSMQGSFKFETPPEANAGAENRSRRYPPRWRAPDEATYYGALAEVYAADDPAGEAS